MISISSSQTRSRTANTITVIAPGALHVIRASQRDDEADHAKQHPVLADPARERSGSGAGERSIADRVIWRTRDRKASRAGQRRRDRDDEAECDAGTQREPEVVRAARR